MVSYATLEQKIRTYTHSTDNNTLTREEETEIFGYLRGLQKEMLQEVFSFDGNILREALGKYARVEEYFSKEQIDDWDHRNKTMSYVRKPLYQQYLKKESRLKRRETQKKQQNFIEWYRQNLSLECFVDICGLYLSRLEEAPDLNGEKKEKQERFQEGASRIDEVYSTIINLNKGLVKAKYSELFPIISIGLSDGVAEEEILQGGNMGLVTAIDKFDHLRGNKFSTYATWWVHNGIERILLNSSLAFRELHNFQNRTSPEGEDGELSPEQLEESRALNAFLYTVSLNNPLKSRDGNSNRDLIDILPDKNSPNPEEIIITAELSGFVDKALSEVVSPREEDVLRRTYGLGGREEQTGVDIGRDYGCSGSNVRRIHAEGIRKLRKYFHRK